MLQVKTTSMNCRRINGGEFFESHFGDSTFEDPPKNPEGAKGSPHASYHLKWKSSG